MRVHLPEGMEYNREQSEGGSTWKDLRYLEATPQEFMAWASHVLSCAIYEAAATKAKK